jgi:outer membrane protein OmpA-like peptidoglycan-associated protein
MDMYRYGINKKMQHRTIAAALLILSLVFLYPGVLCASSGPDNRFTIFKADFDITPVANKDEKLVKDFYVNGGKDDGIAMSTELDVYREKIVRDTFQEKETKISILIGQIKVIKLFENVAITRITNLVYSEKTPVLQYQSVMIGDYAVPRKKKEIAIKKIKIPNKPVTGEARKTPKLYSMIPVTARSGNLSALGVSFASKVLFEFDDWRLKPEALQAISEVMNIFNKSGDKKIVIEGHTCSLGDNSYNLSLSKNRAQSVSDYLVNVKGIPADNVRIEYYGELFPVASNDIETERTKNRRVEMRFLPLSKKERLLQSLVKK